MSDGESKSVYNFDFIMQALGLLPIKSGKLAINLSSIIKFTKNDDGYMLTLRNGDQEQLYHFDLAELEETIKERAEAAAIIQKEAIKQQLKAQADAVNELQGGIAPGGVIVNAPTPKRFRH